MALQGKTTVIKRGNTADNNLLLGAKGEIVVNETTKSLRVHTGTRGGTELLRSDMANLDTGVSSVLDFNGARLRDIGSPVASTDAATKAYVDANSGGGGGSSTLEGLSDVALGGTITSGELLQYDGSAWINSTISLSDLSDSSTVATKTYVDTEIGALGTASTYDVGTGPNNVVKLDGSSKLPAVDGSLLTGVNISGGLLASNNLSDLSNSATARSNLGLGTVATLNSNAVLQVSNNLSELGNVGTARTNLGLGDVATLSTGMSSGQVPLAQDVAILTGGKIAGSVLPLDVITTIGLSALKDVPNGIAGLDSSGHLASSVLPDLAITHVSSGLLADRPAATVDNTGDVYIATDTSQTFISTGSGWTEILNLNSASIADLIGDMDNVKLSFGAIVNSESAAWVGFDSTNYLDSGTDLKTSLEALDTQIKTNSDALLNVLTTSSTLNDLSGVIISGSPNGKFLKNNGTDWVDNVIDHSDVNGLGSSALKTAGTSANNVLLLDNNGEFSGSLITDSSVTSSKISGNIPVAIVSGLGTSATLDVGTTANKVVQLNGSAQLPAVSGVNLTGITASQVSGISGTYAPLASPALTGTPTAPTASPGTSTTQIATTAFVQSEAYTDTDAVAAVNYALANGYNITISGTVNITGTATASTQSANDSSTKVATTEYVQNELSAMLLNDLSDVALGTLSTGQVLKYDGTNWVNGTDNTGGGGGVGLGDNNTWTGENTFNGSYLLVESVSGEDKFKVNNSGNTIDIFTPITLVQDAYLYVKFDGTSSMSDFFYIFTSPDNGITRQVVPLTLIQDSGTDYLQKITSWSMGGTYTFDYSVYSANGFMDYANVGNVPNASFKRDPSLTYYISSWNRNQFSTFDFGLAISDSNDGLNLTYVDLAGSGFDSNMVESIYEVVDNVPTLDATLDDPSYTYDRRMTKVANFDKAYDLTTLARLEVTSIAEVGKLIVNGSTTLGGAIDLGSSGTATTPSANDNSTKVATTAYVQTELSAMVLNDLSDTTVFSPATGETLRYNGSAFVNSKLSFSDLSSTGNAALLTADNNFTGNLKSYGGNLNVYSGKNETFYLFVKYNSTSRNDAEYFYVFSSSDNGVTRESVPLTLIQDTGTDYLEEDTSQGYKRYLASQASAYTNTGTSANAAVVLDMSKTYYFTIRTDNDNTSPNLDFQIYISDNINATGFTYNNVLPYGGGFYSDDNPYTITINSSAWSTISLSSPTSVTNASGLSDSTQVLSIDNDTGNIVSNGYIQLKEQGIAPTPVSTYAQIYAKVDASDTEIYVQDSAGNNTKLSPHNEEGEWEYYSYNKRTGKSIRINMEKMIRTLEAITGEKFIIEE